MEENKAPGEFPEIELGGETYQIKFTRGLLYRLDKMGIQFSPRFTPQGSTCTLSNIIDVLHVVIGFKGTHEELAELAYDKRNDIHTKLVESWEKLCCRRFKRKHPLRRQRKPWRKSAQSNSRPG